MASAEGGGGVSVSRKATATKTRPVRARSAPGPAKGQKYFIGKPRRPPRLPLAGFHYDALFATQNCHKQKRLQYRLTRGDLYYHDHPFVTWLLIGQRDGLEAWPRTPGGRWIIRLLTTRSVKGAWPNFKLPIKTELLE